MALLLQQLSIRLENLSLNFEDSQKYLIGLLLNIYFGDDFQERDLASHSILNTAMDPCYPRMSSAVYGTFQGSWQRGFIFQ